MIQRIFIISFNKKKISIINARNNTTGHVIVHGDQNVQIRNNVVLNLMGYNREKYVYKVYLLQEQEIQHFYCQKNG